MVTIRGRPALRLVLPAEAVPLDAGKNRFLDVRVRLPRELVDLAGFVEQVARDRLGFGQADLRSLLATLYAAARQQACDHTLRLTHTWATVRGLDPDAVVAAVRAWNPDGTA